MLVLVFGMVACGESGASFDVPALNANAAALVEARYADAAQELSSLSSAAEAFCAAPTPAAYATLVARLEATRRAFKRAEVFAFGPYTDSPWRVGPDLDLWPAEPDRIEAFLASDEPLSDGEALERVGAKLKGLPALEYLVHGQDVTRPFVSSEEATVAFQENPRRCDYVRAVVENLGTRLEDLREAWSPEGDHYALELSAPGSTERDIYADAFEAASALFEQMVFTIENVQQLKIGKPLGLRTQGRPEPDSAEARFSERSALYARETLAGARALYDGTPDAGQGIGDWVASRSPELDTQIMAAFDAAEAAIGDLQGVALAQRVSEEPEIVMTAYERLGNLRQLLVVDAAGLLAVTVTFNPTDGD
ncbi:MAG: imelysin family protein [Myxococcota bacterium]